jgi:hypothetical protein
LNHRQIVCFSDDLRFDSPIELRWQTCASCDNPMTTL